MTAISNQQVNVATAEGPKGVGLENGMRDEVLDYERVSSSISADIYLVHAAEIVRARTDTQQGLYRVRVWLEADSEAAFGDCEEVVYRLHDTFAQRTIATKAQNNQF